MTSVESSKLAFIQQITSLPDWLFLDLKNYMDNTLQDFEQKKPLYFGCMKGFIQHMAEDFDAPLEDFEDYMP